MTDDDLRVTIGALLHDIGKVIYRSGDDGRKHGQSGYDFLKEEIGIDDRDVLDCVRYHHAGAIRGAAIEDNSPAYIVYMADNIASSVDRRKTDVEESGFEIHTPLRPVFNILNGAKSDLFYSTKDLEIEKTINYPTKEKQVFTADQYQKIIRNISDNLKGIEWNGEYLNSLLEVMEGNLVYVPSSTSKGEIPDI